MATLFSERSVIAARSSSLSGGAIAGAVIGSVVGAVLIILCAFPFIVRARRRVQQHGDSAQAELGQGPGGPIHPDMEHAVKRLSTDHSVPVPDYGFNGAPVGDGPDDPQKAASLDHQKPHQPPLDTSTVAIQQGLPSPISPPISPTTRSAPSNILTSAPAGPVPSSTDSTSRSKSRLGSIGTVGRDITRELSLTDSNRDITSNGITEEPESLEQSSTHRRFSNIPESIRGFIRRQSGHHRRDSRRSTLEGTRSPSLISDITPQAQPAAPVFSIDTEVRGEAWSYYHPYLSDEPQESYLPTSSAPAPAPATTGLTIVPPVQPFFAPLSPVSPVQADVAPFMSNRPIVEDPDAISPDSDKTVTPGGSKTFSRQSSLFGKKFPGGPLQRTDSLPPPTIVSDIPSPPLQLSIGPSGNPMEFMKPTTDTENAWMLRQEIIKMEASPPPDTFYTPPLPTVDETPVMKTDPSPEPESQPEYNSPPEIEINGLDIENFDMDSFIAENEFDMSDFSTPPASSDLSATNTPDTRLTEPYTASPSPRSDFDPKNAGQLGTSPRAFACDQCHRVFDQIHKLNHHKRYHDRPHECPHAGCTMKFGTKTHLDRHINDKHNKTRKFYCTQPDCPYSRQGGKSFPRKDNWRRHIMNKHRITPDSDPGPQYVDELMGNT
ncbi:zinc finger transcription factor ace1 [Rhypophila decipiens]|uniref:Zinc finger transcription factor ace1 n=1 Tax=Rhypophila decipiens TaxID=261697 RepID=A0AAN6YGQ2_9PEZI|nr:zinc finger transcription factor ace1 [Rhypophila decipiens]